MQLIVDTLTVMFSVGCLFPAAVLALVFVCVVLSIAVETFFWSMRPYATNLKIGDYVRRHQYDKVWEIEHVYVDGSVYIKNSGAYGSISIPLDVKEAKQLKRV